MNYIRDVTIFVFKDGNFLKMTRALIGEGAIVGLFEDMPFRPPQGGHVTHVWEDSALQKFLYVSCVLQNVYKDSCFGQGQSAVWVMVAYAVCRCYWCNCRVVRNHNDVQCQIQGPGMARIPY